MILRIANQTGRIYHAEQHPELAIIRPCYAFVPQTYFGANCYEKNRYLASRWPTINGGANPHAVGSYVIPDPEKPVQSKTRCPVLRQFKASLRAIAAVKASPNAE